MYRICIADDEPYVRKSIAQKIERAGFNIEIVGFAENGSQAVDLLIKEKPDIFFVDINMPVMSGLEFIQQAKEKYAKLHTKFIIISGYDEFKYLQKSIQLGVLNYIRKPVSDEELHEVLSSVIALLDEEHNSGNHVLEMSTYALYNNCEAETMASGTFVFVHSDHIKELISCTEVRIIYVKLTDITHSDDITVMNFLGAPNTVLFQIPAILSPQEIESGIKPCFEHLSDIKAVCFVTSGNKLNQIVFSFDNYLNLRFFERFKWLSIPSVNNPDAEVDLSNLKIAIECGQIERCESIIREEIHSLVASKQTVCKLGLLYRRIIFLFMDSYVHNQLQIPEKLKRELFVLALAKYSAVSDILSFLFVELTSLKNRVDDQQRTSELIEQICGHLEKHYGDRITLKSLADEFFISEKYLSRRFKEKKHINLSQYLETLRMQKAAEYLAYPTLSISEIAMRVGYDDNNYFAKVFKKVFHCSPTEFRALNSK